MNAAAAVVQDGARSPWGPLRADVTYRAPSGRLCRWVPTQGPGRQVTSYAVFVYLDVGVKNRHTEAAGWMEGFHLTPENYQLLREVSRGGQGVGR